MDPLTAALLAAKEVIALISKVWDATSAELKAKEADNAARVAINVGDFILAAQEDINALLKKK